VIFIYNDTLYNLGVLNILFAEIPSLFFYTIISLLTFNWAEITFYKVVDRVKMQRSATGIMKLQPFLIFINLLIYFVVVILSLIYYYSKPNIININCTTTLEDRNRFSTREQISLAFICIYGALSLILSVLLIFFGSLIMRTLLSLPESNFRYKHILHTALVMGYSFLFLSLQTIYLITRSLKSLQWDILSTLIFLYIADVPPVVFFLLSFRNPQRKGSSSTITLNPTKSNEESLTKNDDIDLEVFSNSED